MLSRRAIYDNGRLVFDEGDAPEGRVPVIVTFLGDETSGGDKTAGQRFVSKWRGILKGCDIGDWRDQKADYLQSKGL
jgi:hypothetical protein